MNEKTTKSGKPRTRKAAEPAARPNSRRRRRRKDLPRPPSGKCEPQVGGLTTTTTKGRANSLQAAGFTTAKEIYRGTIFRDLEKSDQEQLVWLLEAGMIYIGRYGCGLSRNMHKEVRTNGTARFPEIFKERTYAKRIVEEIIKAGRYFCNYDELQDATEDA